MKSFLLAFALLLTTTSVISAQALSFASTSKMWVDGTSTVHDWTVNVERVTGTLYQNGSKVDSVRITVPVSSMKSGKSGMDDKVYEALKSTRFPNISISGKNIDLSSGTAVVQASVTIAGTTKVVPVTVKRAVAGSLASYTGTVNLKMTDFKVAPPTAMMGAIKAGDAITLRFDLKTNVR
jgi:polyisoprenoid-binding protein YceI